MCYLLLSKFSPKADAQHQVNCPPLFVKVCPLITCKTMTTGTKLDESFKYDAAFFTPNK